MAPTYQDKTCCRRTRICPTSQPFGQVVASCRSSGDEAVRARWPLSSTFSGIGWVVGRIATPGSRTPPFFPIFFFFFFFLSIERERVEGGFGANPDEQRVRALGTTRIEQSACHSTSASYRKDQKMLPLLPGLGRRAAGAVSHGRPDVRRWQRWPRAASELGGEGSRYETILDGPRGRCVDGAVGPTAAPSPRAGDETQRVGDRDLLGQGSSLLYGGGGARGAGYAGSFYTRGAGKG